MKKLALAAAFAATAATASTAFAGSYAEPVIEPEVIVQDTSSSAQGVIVPLLALILVAAVASN
ncbi:hypothetical protein M2324_000779 [Rhodovulum sulfidophilum]|uniref:hypothetical protein n=1 Tax=Rhodovulum sulfidophilum TaxID=35806 RepID=UPI0005A95E4F|nr:hypothetical protein [Rhodovulum sulfidophilum]ANB33180.1 hypothetical protein A6W98_03250 [Rhodovulum sulfidophilum DSM 1374]ANB37028.1 hypothetical protein A6024_03235 [Rhodovulum sulfidophilum]MCW2302395.1 hypothetical protein [Rhodovulum sulfidophilum]